MNYIGNAIRERREELGMTQDELAELMGYKSRSTIAKIEKGVNDVTQSNVVRLAYVLRTTPAHLLGWDLGEDDRPDLVPIVGKVPADDMRQWIELLQHLDNQQRRLLRNYALFLNAGGGERDE